MKPFDRWPDAALLHLHKTLAYGLFFLGAFFGFVTVLGRNADSMVYASLMGGLLAIALLLIVFIFRISRELERRLGERSS